MKRRLFITRVLLLAGGIISGGMAAMAHIVRGKQKRVTGFVKEGNKGLKGVVVSDGFSVVQTDVKGRFTLNLHTEACFVFISTPAGYAFPEEDFIARHYVPVEKINTDKEMLFSLRRVEGGDERHTFMIWADTQPKTKADMRRMVNETLPDVKQMLSGLKKDTLIHGITVGDIVWDSPELYGDYCDAVKETGIPFFQCIGNHDMDLNQGGDETSDRTFNKWFGPTHYSFNRGKLHYVVLDDVRYLGKNKEYDAHISNQQLAWLRKDLSFVPKDHLIILCAHIPVLRSVKNKQALLAITKGYKMHVMSGHTHVNFNTLEDGIFEHNHGTVCGALWTGDICGDGTPNGYAMYEVDGTELSWYYKSTGFPKEHQFEIYSLEEGGHRELLVNVWNHDPGWKVEYSINGVPKGTLQKRAGMDPVAVQLYEGKELPKGRGFVDPRKTEHLFAAMLPSEKVNVGVVVTDRFGNRFSKEKTI